MRLLQSIERGVTLLVAQIPRSGWGGAGEVGRSARAGAQSVALCSWPPARLLSLLESFSSFRRHTFSGDSALVISFKLKRN